MRMTYLRATRAAALGCSGGPSAVTPPSINAGSAASSAMELYDKNSDGAIAGEELAAAPALKAAMETLDVNKDGSVQEEEIVQRIEAWQKSNAGLSTIAAVVTMNGQPLEGATVTFDPEPFLGEGMKQAVGVTSRLGGVSPIIPKENRPDPSWPAGLQLGLYRVRVSKQANGAETIPAIYNTETTLGQQVSPDDATIGANRVKFDLKSGK